MRKLFFALILMLIGSFAIANNSVEKEFYIEDSNLEQTLSYQSIEIIALNGTCVFHMDIYNDQGEIIQTYDLTWESESAETCQNESRILARFLIAPYL